MELELTDYERDNLLAALLAISGRPLPSPLTAANTGDWVMQLVFKLGWDETDQTTLGKPNATAAEIAERAQR